MTVPIIYLKERLEWLEQENAYLKKQIDVLLMIIANKDTKNGVHDDAET